MNTRFLLFVCLICFSCKKELDINDFTDDFNFYEPELRIEALILPTDSTAIIRIDRSTRLDEGLNEEGYYNCIDDDDDWNYYYCAPGDTSYEMKKPCDTDCSEDCILHFYACDIDSTTFIDRSSCIENCTGGKCITDDVGNDGKAFDEIGFGGETIGFDADGSEGDGKPNCGEPNVDEFDEILPNIHIKNCEVFIIQGQDSCQFIFQKDGGSFFEDVNFGDELLDADLVTYGAWVPDIDKCNVSFNQFDEEYSFLCDCSKEEGFEFYGQITASDTLQRPVVFFHENQLDSLLKCTSFEGAAAIFNCMESFNITDTFYVEIGLLNESNLLNLATNINITIKDLKNPKIFYSSLKQSNEYQLVESIYDISADKWVFYHSHPIPLTITENIIDDKINYMFEDILAEKYRDWQKDDIVLADSFKYDIYTFSEGYKNYYFYDQLDLKDPVRTNLRDENGNTVMGAFGVMARNTINFKVLNADSLLGQ